MQNENIDELKRYYEEKAQQLRELERKFAIQGREKELVDNYCDRLIHFLKESVPNESIPRWIN